MKLELTSAEVAEFGMALRGRFDQCAIELENCLTIGLEKETAYWTAQLDAVNMLRGKLDLSPLEIPAFEKVEA